MIENSILQIQKYLQSKSFNTVDSFFHNEVDIGMQASLDRTKLLESQTTVPT